MRASHARAPLLGKPIGLTPVTYFPSEKCYPPFEQLVEAEGEGNEIDKVEQSVFSKKTTQREGLNSRGYGYFL